MHRIAVAAVCSIIIWSGGCTAVVASSGKQISELMYHHASRGKIESVLGRPQSEESFKVPYPSIQAPDGSAGLASSKAVYEYHGRADDAEQFQAMGMAVGLTLGLGEVVAFPNALDLSRQLDRSVHRYEVWYDDKGKCVSYKASHLFGDSNKWRD